MTLEAFWDEEDRKFGLDEPHPREDQYWAELERGADEYHLLGVRSSRPSELQDEELAA